MANTNSNNKRQKNTKESKPNIFLKGFVNLAGYGCFAALNLVRLPYFSIKKKATRNRAINLAKGLKFPLNGQSMGDLKDMRIGSCDFAHSGCGAIATFNVLSMAGRKPQMEEIVDFYERKGLVFNARFGINPTSVKRFLTEQNLNWKFYSGKKDWDACIQENQVAILMYWWVSSKGCGAHYVSVEKLSDRVRVYNVYGNRDTAYEYKDIQTFLSSDKYKRVVAMFVIDREVHKTTI